jgi:hypothetical protein
MLNFRTGLTALLVAGVGSAFAQSIRVFDDFETGTVGQPPLTSIWNGGITNNGAGTVVPVIATTGSYFTSTGGATSATVNPAKGSQMVYVAPSAATGASGVSPQRYWAKIDPPIATTLLSGKVMVVSFDTFDALNNWDLNSVTSAWTATGGTQRNYVQLTDFSVDYAVTGGFNQILAMGFYNQAGTTGAYTLNGAALATNGNIGNRVAGRIFSVSPGFGVPNTAGTGLVSPGWHVVGVDDPTTTIDETSPRAIGWRRMQMVMDNNDLEYYVNGAFTARISHGREQQSWDSIALTPNLSSRCPAWLDNVTVQEFTKGDVNIRVDLQNVSTNPVSTPTVDIRIEDSSGNPAVGSPFNGLTPDALGAVTVNTTSRGLYNIIIDSATHLQKVISNVDIRDIGSYNLSASLINGDVDGDGEVGPGDFEIVVANFGTSEVPELGDLDRDGEVGPSDFEIVVANFGPGPRILYYTVDSSNNTKVYTMDVDGSGQTLIESLNNNRYWSYNPYDGFAYIGGEHNGNISWVSRATLGNFNNSSLYFNTRNNTSSLVGNVNLFSQNKVVFVTSPQAGESGQYLGVYNKVTNTVSYTVGSPWDEFGQWVADDSTMYITGQDTPGGPSRTLRRVDLNTMGITVVQTISQGGRMVNTGDLQSQYLFYSLNPTNGYATHNAVGRTSLSGSNTITWQGTRSFISSCMFADTIRKNLFFISYDNAFADIVKCNYDGTGQTVIKTIPLDSNTQLFMFRMF